MVAGLAGLAGWRMRKRRMHR
ncbi:MAG: hypothetical protein K2Y35_12695 [Burkholderiales bacterium]|nr:hypothetical protein [Burkholderiales bacterium]